MPGDGKYTQVDSLAAFVARLKVLSDEAAFLPETGLGLATCLEALAAYLADRDAVHRRAGDALPAQPTWQLMADGLHAALYYPTGGEQ